MKIAVIRRECGPSWGGAERDCAQTIKALTELGHQVTLISRKRESLNHEVDFIPVEYTARGSVLKNYLFFRGVRQTLRKAEFDIVYGLSRVHPVDVYKVVDPLHAAYLESRYQDKWSRGLAVISLRHRLLLSLEKKLMLDPQVRIVCMSTLVAAQIEKHYGVDPSSNRLRVIRNGVDLEQFSPAVRKTGKQLREKLGLENRPVLVFAGGEARRKGFDTLIKAMSTLRYPECCLLVVGLTREEVPFQIPLRVQERLRFVGWVSNPEIYYGAADLLVLPTRSDPFGMVCLEAMACGTPALTTAAAGVAEIIEPAKSGFIIEDPESDRELKERVEEYLSLPESQRVMMGEQAAHTATQFSWKRHGEMLIELFQEVKR